ncbi:hypothetical protein [Photobacterium leiognathi]|uniref:hypothetical protein n=1 Tax=Photobacterium leiognathi TaxID=553611 RepID=UPI0029814AD0|nr:hypothetical protein [Photobacterium leiognathi]
MELKLGIPSELINGEFIVSLTPSAVSMLTNKHKVYVVSGAGKNSNFSDKAYKNAGAIIVESNSELLSKAKIILFVSNIPKKLVYELNDNHLIIGNFSLYQSPRLSYELIKSGCTVYSYESLPDDLNPLNALNKITIRNLLTKAHLNRSNLINGCGDAILSAGKPVTAVVFGEGELVNELYSQLKPDVNLIVCPHNIYSDSSLVGISRVHDTFSNKEAIRNLVSNADLIIIMPDPCEYNRHDPFGDGVESYINDKSIIADLSNEGELGSRSNWLNSTNNETNGYILLNRTDLANLHPKTSSEICSHAILKFIGTLISKNDNRCSSGIIINKGVLEKDELPIDSRGFINDNEQTTILNDLLSINDSFNQYSILNNIK